MKPDVVDKANALCARVREARAKLAAGLKPALENTKYGSAEAAAAKTDRQRCDEFEEWNRSRPPEDQVD